MTRSPSTITHMWLSPGRCVRVCRMLRLGRDCSARGLLRVRSWQRRLVGGLQLGGLLEEHDHARQPDAEDHRALQNAIDPFHANGPALEMNTGTAMTSVTICQTVM